MADIKNEPEQLEAPDDPANEQPLVSHLIELRNRIVKAAISILIVFACMSPFMKQIFDYLSRPLMVALPQGVKLLATGVVAPFMVPLKVTLFAAFVVALPYVLYQLWAYIAPALYRREKRLALPVIISSVVMFAVGMAYCYFIVFGMVFKFIAGFSPDSVNFAPDIDSYFSFVLTMFFAFGITFEVPILVVVLNRVGVKSSLKPGPSSLWALSCWRRSLRRPMYSRSCCLRFLLLFSLKWGFSACVCSGAGTRETTMTTRKKADASL